jgi:hypothetical protein
MIMVGDEPVRAERSLLDLLCDLTRLRLLLLRLLRLLCDCASSKSAKAGSSRQGSGGANVNAESPGGVIRLRRPPSRLSQIVHRLSTVLLAMNGVGAFLPPSQDGGRTSSIN